MKTHIKSVLLLAAALSASALSAAPKNASPIAYSSVNVSVGGDHIERGAPRERVRALMGYPKQELSRNVWLYRGFAADLPQAKDQGCTTLMITFANDQVVDLRLINERAAAVFAANVKFSPSVRAIASNVSRK